MVLTCRFYEGRFPEVDDVVMVNVRSIAEMGAYVTLLEYNNIDGMILLSELSRRRIRSINKLIRVGRNECVVVLRVDKEKVRVAFFFSFFFFSRRGFSMYLSVMACRATSTCRSAVSRRRRPTNASKSTRRRVPSTVCCVT